MYNKIRKSIISVGTMAMIVSPVIYTISCAKDNNDNPTKPFVWKKQKFSSKSELLSYMKESDLFKEEKKKENSDDYRWKLEGIDRTFSGAEDLKKYLFKNNVKQINADILLDNVENFNQINLEDNGSYSFPLNAVIENKPSASNGRAYIFKTSSGGLLYTRDKSMVEKTRTDAKSTWIQIHNAYLFNGIYFANKQDLQYYLKKEYTKLSTNSSLLNKLTRKTFVLPANNELDNDDLMNFSQTNNKLNTESISYNNDQELRNDLKEKIKANSKWIISEQESDGTWNYYREEDFQKGLYNSANLIKTWNFGDSADKNMYIIDSEIESRGNLIGNYYVETTNDIGSTGNNGQGTGIGNLNSREMSGWKDVKVTSAMTQPNSLLFQSQMGGLVTSIFKSKKIDISFEGFIKYLSNENINLGLNGNDFFEYINNLDLKYNNINNFGSDLKRVSKNLSVGKKSNPFLMLPIIRTWLISRLVENGVLQVDLERINSYFIVMANKLTDLIYDYLRNFDKKISDLYNAKQLNKVNLSDIWGFDKRNQKLFVNPDMYLELFNQSISGQVFVTQVRIQLSIETMVNRSIAKLWQGIEGLKEISERDFNHNNNIYDNHGSGVNTGPNYEEIFKGVYVDKEIISEGTKEYIKNNIKHSIKNNVNNVKGELQNYFDNSIEKKSKILINIISKYNTAVDVIKRQFEKDWTNKGEIDKKINAANWEYLKTSALIKNKEFEDEEFLVLNMMDNMLDSKTFLDDGKTSEPISMNFKKYINNPINFAKNIADIRVSFNELTRVTKKISGIMKFIKGFSIGLAVADALFIFLESLIDFLTLKKKQIYWQYKTSDGKTFIWDGGERTSQFWGLAKNETFGIHDLKLINPIKIFGGSLRTNQFYFNGDFYSSKTDVVAQVYKEINARFKTNNIAEIMKMFFKDNVSLKFAYKTYDGTKIWKEEKDLDPLLDSMMRENHNNKYKVNKYWTQKGWTTDMGIAIDEYVNQVISDIDPVYIFQIPDVESDGSLSEKPFSLPYPFYSLEQNGIRDKSGQNDSINKLQYIYDPNIDKNTVSSKVALNKPEIITKYLGKVSQLFEIPEKITSLENVLKVQDYDDVRNRIIHDMKIFKVTSPLGQIKYFINLEAAYKWLKIEYNYKLNYAFKASNIYIYIAINKKQFIFNTVTEMINWVYKNETVKAV